MKRGTLLLAGSLAVNAAFVLWLARPSVNRPAALSADASASRTIAHAPAALTSAQIAALQSGNRDQLKAAGVPDEVANILAAGRAYAKLEAFDHADKKALSTDPRYWRKTPLDQPSRTPEQQAAETKAKEEFDAAMSVAFPDYESNDSSSGRYSYLPAGVRKKLERIETDYDEIEDKITSLAENGPLLPSDQAKLKLVRQEKRRDIDAALTPDEREALQLHDSPAARIVISRYGDAIQSEADYRKVVSLWQAYDDRFASANVSDPDVEAARRAASVQLQSDIVDVIGEKNYADFQHADDENYKSLVALSKRLELPANTPDVVYTVRDSYALQSQAINQNAALTDTERRAQLQALAEKAGVELQTSLGIEGAAAYTRRAYWIDLMKLGTAFSTNPKQIPANSGNSASTVSALPNPRH